MYISFASILTLAALAGTVSAKKNNHNNGKHNPKGRAFQHILQIWFENQVNTILMLLFSLLIFILGLFRCRFCSWLQGPYQGRYSLGQLQCYYPSL